MKAQYDRLWEMQLMALVPALCVKPLQMSREYSQQLIRGETIPRESVTFNYKLGAISRDMISTSAVGRYLLSSRLFELFRTESFSGWKSYPAIIIGKDGKHIGGYQGLQITGRAADRDTSRGISLPQVRGALPQKTGLYFQNDEWDGSDFFLCGLRIVVTERVREAMQSIKVDNIGFARVDTIKMVTALKSSS